MRTAMSDILRRLVAISFVFYMLPGLALADVKISLRLHGGWAYLSGGDVNKGTQALFDWAEIYFAPPYLDRIEGGFTPLHLGYEVGGDLIFELSRALGIGIGSGYTGMSRAAWESWMDIHHSPDEFYYSVMEVTNLSAVPIRLSLFLKWPIGRKIEIAANAGLASYLRTRYRADWYLRRQYYISFGNEPSNNISTRAKQKKLPIGLQAAIGVEYRLLPKICLFVEGRGRYVRFRGFEGTSASMPGWWGGILPSFSEQGELYYESVPMLPGAPRLIMVQSSPPAGPSGEPRRAVVDLSGVSLMAGLRIYF